MSVSLERNNVIHMDGYHKTNLDTDAPLLSQIAADFEANGFTNAGPNITRITIAEKDLSHYIDRFMAYYYNSAPEKVGEGAFGIFGTPIKTDFYVTHVKPATTGGTTNAGRIITSTIAPTYDVAYLTTEASKLYYDDASVSGARFKYIHPSYDDANWNQEHWKYSPQPWGGQYAAAAVGQSPVNSKTIATDGTSGTQPAGAWLGPNAELFSYLNPHPNQKVGGEFLKKDPAGATVAGSRPAEQGFVLGAVSNQVSKTNFSADAAWRIQQGYVGIGTVAQLVYKNEYNKIKRIMTSNARGVKLYPENSDGTQGAIEGTLQQYKETLTPTSHKHDFWISTSQQDQFFPSSTLPPSVCRGTVALDLENANNTTQLQLGDSFLITIRDYVAKRGDELVQDFDAVDTTSGATLSVTNPSALSQNAADKRTVIVTDRVSGELLESLKIDSSGNSLPGTFVSVLNLNDVTLTDQVPTGKNWRVRVLALNESTTSKTTGGSSFSIEVDSATKSIEGFRNAVVSRLNATDAGGYGGHVVFAPNAVASSIIDYAGNTAGVDIAVHITRTQRTDVNYANGFSAIGNGADRTNSALWNSPYPQAAGNTGDPGTVLSSLSNAGSLQTAIRTRSNDFVNSISDGITVPHGNFRGIGKSVSILTDASGVPTGAFGYTSGDNSNIPMYTNGYVHQIKLGGTSEDSFNGCNAGDTFTFTISGLIDEGDASPHTAATITKTITWSAPRNFSNGQTMMISFINALNNDAYFKKYTTLEADGDALKITYSSASSGYLVRSKVGVNYGLFKTDSAIWSGMTSADWVGNFPPNAANTEASVVAFYNAYSGLGAGYAVGTPATVGQVYPAFASDNTSTQSTYVTVLFGNAGQVKPNAIAVADLPAKAIFNAKVEYVKGSSITYMPLDLSQTSDTAPVALPATNIKFSFPFARDLGTFANPPTHTNPEVGVQFAGQLDSTETAWAAIPANDASGTPQAGPLLSPSEAGLDAAEDMATASIADTVGGNTKYFSSYKQHVIGRANFGYDPANGYTANGYLYAGDRADPAVSFDKEKVNQHPNISDPDPSKTWRDFVRDIASVPIENFENITDNSIGPLLFDTPTASNGLSGPEGDQQFRIRFNVSRGEAVEDASPFIATRYIQGLDAGGRENTQFEFLTVHVATKYQLQGDGNISRPEGRDGIKNSVIREPGFLGTVRPQYAGYMQTRVHNVAPYVQNKSLQDALYQQRRLGIVKTAGLVGYADNKNTDVQTSGQKPLYNDRLLGGSTEFFYDSSDVQQSGNIAIDYRYEENFIQGSSTELVHDTPFNDGRLRLQQGWFKRTGKANRQTALSFPMNYVLTIADHGIFFMLKDQASSLQEDDNAWFVIQRHVDATTGSPDMSSLSQPVHCLYAASTPSVLYSDLTPFFTDKTTQDRSTSIFVAGLVDNYGTELFDFKIDPITGEETKAIQLEEQSKYRRFVVREKDVLKPWDRHVFAGMNERDSHAILNTLEQLSLNEEGQLVIQFPNRLGSQRYFYTGAEMDIVAFADGGAIGEGSLITSDRFSTTGTKDKRRLYRAGPSSKGYGNGMRILYLAAGWGIANTDVETALLTS